jgi:hypothetical protein
MITKHTLSKNYQPFNSLTICSNSLLGGGTLVAIGDVLPLLIGKGEKPKVWLQALADPKKNTFVSIVEESISKHPAVKVYEDSGALKVLVGGEQVLSVRELGEDGAVVDQLDLRPIGLNIYGDKSSLKVGGNEFSRNSMSGGGTLIGFGA